MIEALRRDLGGAVPALIVSAEAAEAIRRLAEPLGVPVLEKPVAEAELRRALRRAARGDRREGRPGLRARLMLGALSWSSLALAAAGLAVYGLARTQALAAEALAAQRRIEAYGALSARRQRVDARLARPRRPAAGRRAWCAAPWTALDRLVGRGRGRAPARGRRRPSARGTR